jgi:hypothetical protein
MQQAVLDSILPGRELATIGRWPPTPLPAPILPKVRDRLAALMRADDRLPLGLDHPDTRGALAASLDAARLNWIDEEFIDLANHAARSLPTTAINAADAPAQHGLLAWAQPVGERANLTSASACIAVRIRTWSKNHLPETSPLIDHRPARRGESLQITHETRPNAAGTLPCRRLGRGRRRGRRP